MLVVVDLVSDVCIHMHRVVQSVNPLDPNQRKNVHLVYLVNAITSGMKENVLSVMNADSNMVIPMDEISHAEHAGPLVHLPHINHYPHILPFFFHVFSDVMWIMC